MSLVRLTSKAELQEVRNWARPPVFQSWLALLKPEDFERVKEAMNEAIDRMDVVRAQYIVCKEGAHWHDVYMPVYEAMQMDRGFSGKFIGLILWEVMVERDEAWGFHKVDKRIVDEQNLLQDIEVMEYFRSRDFPRPGRWRDNA